MTGCPPVIGGILLPPTEERSTRNEETMCCERDAQCLGTKRDGEPLDWNTAANTVIRAAAVLGAILSLSGVFMACARFYARQKAQDRELSAIRSELTVLCYGVRACLSGLKEQGCNGPVTDALNHLDKHLNREAHKGESGM